jgi:hypothetical protein
LATKYPTALDDDSTIPDDPVVDGVTTGHDTHHPNAHGAIRALEAKLGVGSSTAAAATTGWVPVKQADGTTAWAAAPAGTPATTVTALDFTTGSAVGTATTYAREDHKHKSDRFLLPFVWTLDTVTSPLTLNYTLPVLVAADLYAFGLALTTPASSGSNTKVDLLVGGTTRLSTQPEIVVGQTVNTIAAVFSSTSLSVGTTIKVATTQGSSGGPLSIVLLLQIQVPS